MRCRPFLLPVDKVGDSEQKEDVYARDLLEQTWRNAQILVAKYRFLKRSFHWLAAAVFPWILVLAILSTAP